MLTKKTGGGDKLPGIAYKEYRLEDYSKWLQHKVNNTKMWTKIRKCLVRRHACKKMTRDWANITLQQFYTKRLSSIEVHIYNNAKHICVT